MNIVEGGNKALEFLLMLRRSSLRHYFVKCRLLAQGRLTSSFWGGQSRPWGAGLQDPNGAEAGHQVLTEPGLCEAKGKIYLIDIGHFECDLFSGGVLTNSFLTNYRDLVSYIQFHIASHNFLRILILGC